MAWREGWLGSALARAVQRVKAAADVRPRRAQESPKTAVCGVCDKPFPTDKSRCPACEIEQLWW